MASRYLATTYNQSKGARSQRDGFKVELLFSGVTAIFSVFFSFLLIWVYADYVTVRFAYMGHHWIPNYIGLTTGIIATGVVAFFLPRRLSRAGDLLIYILFLMAYLPAMVIPSAFSRMDTNDLVILQLVLSGCFLGLLWINSVPIVRIDLSVFSARGYTFFLVGIWLGMLAPIVYYMGVPSQLPGFGDVYELRFQARDSIDAAPPLIAFLYTMMGGVVRKILFVYGLVTRRPLLVVAGIGTSLYLYGISGHKSSLFQLGLLVAIIVGVLVFQKSLVRWILPAAVTVVLVAILGDLLFPGDYLKSLLVRRVFIVPGILTGYYFEFFSNNPQLEWSYSFLRFFGSSPYESTPPFIIGEHYFNNPATSANANIWSDGFANFGYSGMAVATLVAGIVIWLFNSASLGRSFVLVSALTTSVLISFASSAVFTSILTHGVLLLLLLIFLSPTKPDANRDIVRDP